MTAHQSEEKATLMRRFWLWRCDRCGLLTYPPERRPDDEPDIVCECWSGPRWVRYLALHPDSPDEKDARRRARAAAALSDSRKADRGTDALDLKRYEEETP